MVEMRAIENVHCVCSYVTFQHLFVCINQPKTSVAMSLSTCNHDKYWRVKSSWIWRRVDLQIYIDISSSSPLWKTGISPNQL